MGAKNGLFYLIHYMVHGETASYDSDYSFKQKKIFVKKTIEKTRYLGW